MARIIIKTHMPFKVDIDCDEVYQYSGRWMNRSKFAYASAGNGSTASCVPLLAIF